MGLITKFENFIEESEKLPLSDVEKFKTFLKEATRMQLSTMQDFRRFIEKADEIRVRARIFNILKTLGVWRREVSHTYVISWLLNPVESHGLGDMFLTRFLGAIELGQLNLENVRVKRFRRSKRGYEVDLTVENEDFYAIIENKITHKAQKKQLATEFEEFNPHDSRRFLSIYLTPFEKDVPHEDFKVVTYQDVRSILNDLIENCSNGDVKTFLRHYVDSIEEIVLGKFEGFNERSKLYSKYYGVISEFERAFKSDVRKLFSAIEDEIKQQEWFTPDWQVFFSGVVIQIFKSNWKNEKHTGIHYEVYYGKGEIEKNLMYVLLHIEGSMKNKEQFTRELYALSKEDLKKLTDYEIRGKGTTFLQKEVKIDEKTIVNEITKEINRIAFLGNYVDELLKKPEFA